MVSLLKDLELPHIRLCNVDNVYYLNVILIHMDLYRPNIRTRSISLPEDVLSFRLYPKK